MRIVFSCRAAAFDQEGEITDAQRLAALDGVSSEDVCSTYFYHTVLEDIEISGGALVCRYEPGTGELRVVTEYCTERRLTQEELKALRKETEGQWSDGIGEGGLGDPRHPGVRVYPWPFLRDHDVRVREIDDRSLPPRRSPLLAAARRGAWPNSGACWTRVRTGGPATSSATPPCTSRSMRAIPRRHAC
jgi:hypothetical protein